MQNKDYGNLSGLNKNDVRKMKYHREILIAPTPWPKSERKTLGVGQFIQIHKTAKPDPLQVF